MSEILYIRLGSQAQDKLTWLVINTVEQEIIASGELANAEQLSDLTEKAAQRLVKVFVPGCDVVLKRLAVPTKSQRAMRSAVPYMLEDELAQDVDDLFFAYAKMHEESREHNCFVAIVQREQMQMWQSWLATANISASTLQPDMLAMPYIEGQWSAIALDDNANTMSQTQIVVRQGPWQGVTLDNDAWQFLLTHILSPADSDKKEKAQDRAQAQTQDKTAETSSLTLNAYSDLPYLDMLTNQDTITLVKAEQELPLALLAQHCHQSDFTLLQGEFKVKEQRSKNVGYWLWAAGFAACALCLNVGYKSAQLWQLSAQKTQVEAQIVAHYKKAVPSNAKVRIGTIKSQLTRKIEALGGVTEQAGFLSVLSKVQPAFAKVPGLKPDSLKFDGKRQELRIQALASDYQAFERFKSALNTTGLTIKQGAQSNRGDQVTGSFSVVSKPSNTNSKGGA